MAKVWFYTDKKKRKGPVTRDDLGKLAQGGQLRSTDLVWEEGSPDWVKASTVEGLFTGIGDAATAIGAGDRPARRYRPQEEDDWDDDEEFEPRPRPRRGKIQLRRRSWASAFTLSPFVIFLIVLVVIALSLALFTAFVKEQDDPPPGPGPHAVKPFEKRDGEDKPPLLGKRPLPEPPAPLPKPSAPLPEPPPPPDPGSAKIVLRAHWSFEEGAGIKAKDSGPYGLEAILHGCKWAPGVRGMALQLNGTTDYVRLSPSEFLSFADKAPFTVAAWVKTSKPKGMILSLRPETDSPYDMLNVCLKGEKLVVQIRHQGNPFYPDEATSTSSIHDDKWHHFAVTRTDAGEVILFLDGNRNAKAIGRFGGSQSGKLITSNRALGVEAMLLTAERHPLYDHARLEGCIDELYFFEGALGDEAIRKLSTLE
jgi:hypothetical protein